MSEQNAFERILRPLYDAMLDDTYWPDTSALIDEACGVAGNALLVGEGPPDDIRVLFGGPSGSRRPRVRWRSRWPKAETCVRSPGRWGSPKAPSTGT